MSKQIKAKGIDVSKWQGDIDWKKVKASKLIDFAIIRIGFGTSTGKTCTKDPKFDANMKNAFEVGIKLGVYIYSYAKSKKDAIVESNFVTDTLNKYEEQGILISYPVVFDQEDESLENLTNDTRTDIICTFCNEIEKHNYYAAVYASKHWFETKVNLNRLLQYDKWVAHYSKECTFKSDYGIWQYSENEEIDGIKGKVDMNYAYKNYPAVTKKLRVKNQTA